ncbi:MAG: type II toxin-antitoxin system VapC family toxin [Spirochaetia bacterium]|nr:type II toxin-antitoxin system VapC family toxin [Spirochaetia bacterium]
MSVGNDIVIDASVFVASSLRDEPHHGEAHAMLLSFSDVMPHIHLPSLALLEVASAVARRTGRAAQAKRLAEALADIPGVTLYELSFEHARQGLELLEQGPLRAADIVYVILALQVRAELITLDKEMHKHARSLVRVRRPSEWMRGF